MKLKDEELIKWVVLMSSLNKRRGGVSINELLTNRNLEMNKVISAMNKAISEGYLIMSDKKGALNPYYIPTKKGERLFIRLRTNEAEFLRLIKFTQPEFELGYRIRNLEFLFFYALLAFFSYNITLLLIKSNHLIWGLLFGAVTFIFIGLSSSYIGQILASPINEYFISFFGGTYSLLDKKSKATSTIITIILIILAFEIWYKLDIAGFKNNIGVIIITIIFTGATGIAFIRNWILQLLNKIKDYLKEELEFYK